MVNEMLNALGVAAIPADAYAITFGTPLGTPFPKDEKELKLMNPCQDAGGRSGCLIP